MVASVGLSGAEPMGCAFTYQGRLIEAGSPAQGEYDFQFELYDEPVDGNQLNGTIEVNEVNVSDGYFTVLLDFGAGVFNGDARWLDIGVRHGALEDPNTYADLEPRQEVTPTPYALYAETTGGDYDWMVDGNDMYPIPSGNVGIGTTSPGAKLEVAGQVKITGGSPGEGNVLTSDADGLASWQDPSAFGLPSGVIVMWSGTLGTIPAGWALCDGTNGTPDLRDRFIYGVSAGQNPGVPGGSLSHSHTVNSHTHTVNPPNTETIGGSGLIVGPGEGCAWADLYTHTHYVDIPVFNSGSSPAGTSSEAHLPPYYKLAFIMNMNL
jgi:hypothetical protein